MSSPRVLTGFGPHGERSPLDIAHGELAVREVPPGLNRGPRVDYYQQLVGLPVPADPTARGHAWCCAFAYFCFHATGRWFPRTAKVVSFARIAAAHRLPEGVRPKPGDIGVHFSKKNPGLGHITIIKSDLGHELEDISGNTSPAGHRDGQGVFIVARPLAYYDGFFRL